MIRQFQSQRMTCPSHITKKSLIYLNMCSIRSTDFLKITKKWRKKKSKSCSSKEERRPMRLSTTPLTSTTKPSTVRRLSLNNDRISESDIMNQLPQLVMTNEPRVQPNKRRGRPQKRLQQEFEAEQLFSIHDNVFHAALLFYTFHIFDKTPSRNKFNPTIGFSLYQKYKQLSPTQRDYYDNDRHALDCSQKYKDNQPLVNFFVNSMTFGPACVIDQFYSLFLHIIDQPQQPEVSNCLLYIKNQNFKFLDFNCAVLELLEIRATEKRKMIRTVIDQQLNKFLQIIIHTLWALKNRSKQNGYCNILQSEEELFERRTHNKGRKIVKT